MKFHPLADIFPLLNDQAFSDLVEDIKTNGLREPIWLYDDAILDGRNRWRACVQAGVDPLFRPYAGDDPLAFVLSLNLHRRHLDESQRSIVAAKVANLSDGQRADQAAQICAPAVTQDAAAEMLNVSRRTVQSARRVVDHGADELVQAVEAGRVSVSAAADVAELPKQQQAEIVARGEKEILEAAKAIRTAKSEQRRKQNDELKAAALAVDPPAGKFRCIVIDPPWEMQKIERDVRPNQVAFDYPTMTEGELAAFDVAGMADEHCHLFCWTTHKHLPMALSLLEAWGFRYVCTMVWHKPGGFQPIGLPQYNCEFALYARRGSPDFIDTKQFFTCFDAPRREHSRKPDEFYDLIRRVTAEPRIDVFSRERREGFEQYGNETGKFAA